MDEYSIIAKYGVEIGILGAFIWAFRKVLSSVLDDKAATMEVIGKNTEAFFDLKGSVKESCRVTKENRDAIKDVSKSMNQIHEFWVNKNGEFDKWDGNERRKL